MNQAADTLSTPDRYPLVLRVLHWSMAVAFLALFVLGIIMVDLPKEDTLRPTLFALHKSIGVLSIILLVLRIRLRLQATLPAPRAGLLEREVLAAAIAHKLLYGLMLVVPVVGWAHSDLHGRGVKLFGLPLPKLFPTVEGIGGWTGEVHGFLAYALLTVVVGHVAGVIKHRVVDHKDVLSRML